MLRHNEESPTFVSPHPLAEDWKMPTGTTW